jgi:hypothetical protein
VADEKKKANTQAQITKLEKLQDLILDDLIYAVENKTITATDRATIIRLLQSNGWSLDPAQIPSDLRDKLTNKVRFDEDISPDETGERKLRLS